MRLVPVAAEPSKTPAAQKAQARTELGLVCRGGRVGFLESLVRDLMSLGGPAQLGELARHEVGFGNGSQYTDSRFAAGQLAAEPLAIGLIQSQALVVKRAQQAAAYQADGETDRGEQRQDQALPTLRFPTFSTLTSPSSLRTRTPMASWCATPESFSEAAAVSADASSWKIAKTTVLFAMSVPSCVGRAR